MFMLNLQKDYNCHLLNSIFSPHRLVLPYHVTEYYIHFIPINRFKSNLFLNTNTKTFGIHYPKNRFNKNKTNKKIQKQIDTI